MKRISIYFFIKETILGIVNAILMIFSGALIAGFFIYQYQTPPVSDLSHFAPAETSTIYDRTGKIPLYEMHGEENRKVLAHDEIPDIVRKATIAAEDKKFYSHFGIDVFSILRALKKDIEERGMSQGGSTITQQLARNIYLTREKTLERKMWETFIAFKLERNFTKDQILDLYLNEVPYGSNAYGIEAAAETYFKKNAKDLSLNEAVFLSALPKAPSYFSPYGSHRDEIVARYKDILDQLAEMKVFPQEDIDEAKNSDILDEIVPFHEPIIAPHFVFYVIDELEKKYGKDFLERGGLKVVTTLDVNMQKMAEQSVAEGVVRNAARGAENAALVALDPKSGEILAMVGSRDYFDKSIDGEVNVITEKRQPGSSFKPIVYATAFEKGFQPETLIADVPTNFGPQGNGRDYIPRNYDGKFHGVLPMRKTLAMSLNIPAIKTLAMVGLDDAIAMAHRLGITTLNDRARYGLSLAIGGAEVKPIDLTSAFSVFANDGVKHSPSSIREIIGKDGKEDVASTSTEGEEVIDPQVARKINSILSDNAARTPVFGPKSPLFIPEKIVAAKTGTTQEFRDAWTVGYTPNIAVGVWAGNNDSRPMNNGSDGVFVAAPIWRSFMDKVLPNYSSSFFAAYDSLKLITVKDKNADMTDQKKNEKKRDKKKKNG